MRGERTVPLKLVPPLKRRSSQMVHNLLSSRRAEIPVEKQRMNVGKCKQDGGGQLQDKKTMIGLLFYFPLLYMLFCFGRPFRIITTSWPKSPQDGGDAS